MHYKENAKIQIKTNYETLVEMQIDEDRLVSK